MRHFVSLSFAALITLSSAPSLASDIASEPKDRITIISVEPPGPVTRGVEAEFLIDIDVQLQSAEEAVVRLGFNTDSPDGFRIVKSAPCRRGIAHFVFRVTVIPPDWGGRGQFSAYVNLGPRDPQPRFAPWVSDTKAIGVVP